MADPVAVAQPQQQGLRRRHQARIFRQNNTNNDDVRDENRNNGEPEDTDDGTIPHARILPPQRPFPAPPGFNNNNNNNNPQQHVGHAAPDVISFRASRLYCVLSILMAVLSIIVVSPPPNLAHLLFLGGPLLFTASNNSNNDNMGGTHLDGAGSVAASAAATKAKVLLVSSTSNENKNKKPLFGVNKADKQSSSSSSSKTGDGTIPAADEETNVASSTLDSVVDGFLQSMQQLWNLNYFHEDEPKSDTEKSQQELSEASSPKKKAGGRRDKRSKDTPTTMQQQEGAMETTSITTSWWSQLWDPFALLWGTNSTNVTDDAPAETWSFLLKQARKFKENDVSTNIKKKQASRQEKSTEKTDDDGATHSSNTDDLKSKIYHHLYVFAKPFVDPSLLHPTPHTATDIIDKILTSTPRLLSIANFMLAMTYLLHSAVAAWFLGPQVRQQQQGADAAGGGGGGIFPLTRQQGQGGPPSLADWPGSSNVRERIGGFLVFKLLLISAIVAPDTLDLLILLTWYTTMSCLRSLDHLAHSTTTHLLAIGQPPRKGVVQLLFWVLVCDSLAAASCVALFHAAGWGMVLLLIFDCALLACDVLQHILKHFASVLEDVHSTSIQALETQQLELHNRTNNRGNDEVAGDNHYNDDGPSGNDWEVVDDEDDSILESDSMGPENDEVVAGTGDMQSGEPRRVTPLEIQEESRRLDRRMEVLEVAHARKLSILESAIFALDLIGQLFQVFHFCHIWSLHGIQFTLIDGVLALHLHSAISSACKKIAQRRNHHCIARDLEGHFPDATDEELRKASAAGDVCCICLGTMSTGGHVKKVRCNHLYHTHCLREVVERAQSIHSAKCPLCRSPMADGTPLDGSVAPGNPMPGQQQVEPVQPAIMVERGNADAAQLAGRAGDRAVFHFSTEHILPAWLHVPAFSFEVVRRPPARGGAEAGAAQPLQQRPQGQELPQQAEDVLQEMPVPRLAQAAPQAPGDTRNNQPSFLRRFLVLAGAIPMSPEEEARAIAQLVDMFPQYDRSDLLRELRQRGSAEAVAEAVLMGIFSGIPRGD